MNSDFHWETDGEGIAWLSIDKQGGEANVLSEPMLEGLDEVIVEIAQSHPRGLVIQSAKRGGFIAGRTSRPSPESTIRPGPNAISGGCTRSCNASNHWPFPAWH